MGKSIKALITQHGCAGCSGFLGLANCDQVGLKVACSAKETNYNIEIGNVVCLSR